MTCRAPVICMVLSMLVIGNPVAAQPIISLWLPRTLDWL